MDRTTRPEGNISDIQHGWDVYGSDEQKVGNISEVRDTYVVAHKGIFFPKNLYIPFTSIERVEHDRVYLNITKDDVDNQGWDSEPMAAGGHASGRAVDSDVSAGPPPKPDAVGTPGLTGTADEGGRQMRASGETSDTGYSVPGRERDVAAIGTGGGNRDRTDMPMEQDTNAVMPAAQGVGSAMTGADAPVEGTSQRGARNMDNEGGQTLHLHEEELRVNKERVQAGEVRLGKEVVEEQQTVTVPVTREEVFIERRPGDRRPDEHAISDSAAETVSVPVSEERANVEKVSVVSEEVGVGTRQVQETQQVTDTVKREEARIEKPDDVRVTGSSDVAADGGATATRDRDRM